MLINAINVTTATLIKRIDYSKRNKQLDSSVINLTANKIECKIKNVKITKTLNTATNIASSVKRLTGELIVLQKEVIVSTNDVIEYKDHKYTIQVANPIEEERKVLVAFNRYYIEAIG